MSEEILNLEHNRRILLEKALARAPDQRAAARLLGVSVRTLARMIDRAGLQYDYITKTYTSKHEHPIR